MDAVVLCHLLRATTFPILAVTVVIGIFITAVLLINCCRHSGLRRRPHYHYMPPVLHGVGGSGCRGLEPSAIGSIPVIAFVKGGRCEDEECAVCLNEFHEEERLKLLPGCSHGFHIDCIDVWLQFNANCPLCRSEIEAPPVLNC